MKIPVLLQLLPLVFLFANCSGSCGDDGDNGPPYVSFNILDTNQGNEDIQFLYPADSITFFESDNTTPIPWKFDINSIFLNLFDHESLEGNLSTSTVFMHLPAGDVDTMVVTFSTTTATGRCSSPLHTPEKVNFNGKEYSGPEPFSINKE